jgi:phosphatidylinositol-3,4,5-trisphosphate 3-phosphatase and dual-specificity protein phosphatase PTEN
MTSRVRKAVSKKKRRYVDKENGLDLDLSYITKKVVAMGFPSESVEGMYRNPYTEVVRWLNLEHKDHNKVYNLCSERGYPPTKFDRVAVFSFDDHNPPAFEVLEAFCKDVHDYLQESEPNVACIHCKAVCYEKEKRRTKREENERED